MATKKSSSKSPKESDRPKSRESSRSSSRAGSRGSTATQKPKESAVLTDGSLAILSREVGPEKENGLVLAMYLCVPNRTIVEACNEASEVGLRDANETQRIETCQKLLLTWKYLKAGSKEKEKVKDLERALREMGKQDIADVINDKHANNVELTSDAFSN